MLPTRRSLVLSEDVVQPINRTAIAETGVIPPGLQMIRDTWAFEPIDMHCTVVEGINGKERQIMRVSGLFQKGDLENANGRYYSTGEVLAPAVREIQEDVTKRAIMGEYDHPADAKIHLDRVSHLITKVWMDGRKVFGEAEILHKLPCGACLRGLFEHKVQVGISSRGVGDMEVVERDGSELYRVMPGYQFVTWDAVAEPSVSGAILQIQENLNRRLRPVRQQRNKFAPEVYRNLLVDEINKFFDLD